MIKKIVLFACLFSAAFPAAAFSVIRDTETESVLLGFVQAFFKAGGLNPDNARVVLINDSSINAFVAGGQTVYVHTGLLTQASSPDEAAFVLAHETGHILGGHSATGYEQYKSAESVALISSVIGGLIGMAAGRPDAGVAMVLGAQSSAMGLFNHYRQTQESAADRRAVDLLHQTGYSLKGFQGVMKKLKMQEQISFDAGAVPSYLRTHPLTQERMNDMARFVQKAPAPKKQENFSRIQAKLRAFLDPPATLKNAYLGDQTSDLYARAIILYRTHKIEDSLILIDKLIAREPDNPYFHELKGQFLFETARLDEAIQSYQTAVRLQGAPLLRLALAQALLERNQADDADRALGELKTLTAREAQIPLAWELMATAYDRQGNPAGAQYAMAEVYLLRGEKEKARRQAQKTLDNAGKTAFLNDTLRRRLQDIAALK